MKKLSKKELEIVVEEIGKKVSEIKVGKLEKEFNESEEGKVILEKVKEVRERLVVVNELMEEVNELRKKYLEDRDLVGYSVVDLECNWRGWGKGFLYSVEIDIGKKYKGGLGSFEIKKSIERELVLNGIKGEFDLDKLMKEFIEKYS